MVRSRLASFWANSFSVRELKLPILGLRGLVGGLDNEKVIFWGGEGVTLVEGW